MAKNSPNSVKDINLDPGTSKLQTRQLQRKPDPATL